MGSRTGNRREPLSAEAVKRKQAEFAGVHKELTRQSREIEPPECRSFVNLFSIYYKRQLAGLPSAKHPDNTVAHMEKLKIELPQIIEHFATSFKPPAVDILPALSESLRKSGRSDLARTVANVRKVNEQQINRANWERSRNSRATNR